MDKVPWLSNFGTLLSYEPDLYNERTRKDTQSIEAKIRLTGLLFTLSSKYCINGCAFNGFDTLREFTIPDDSQCIFDYVATGNEDIARVTMTSNVVVRQNTEILCTFVRTVVAKCYHDIRICKTVSIFDIDVRLQILWIKIDCFVNNVSEFQSVVCQNHPVFTLSNSIVWFTMLSLLCSK